MGFLSWVKRNIGGIGGAVLGTLVAPGIGTAIGAGLGSKTVDNKSWKNALLTGGLGYGAASGLGSAFGGGVAAGTAGTGGVAGLAGSAGPGGASSLLPVTTSTGYTGLSGAGLANAFAQTAGNPGITGNAVTLNSILGPQASSALSPYLSGANAVSSLGSNITPVSAIPTTTASGGTISTLLKNPWTQFGLGAGLNLLSNKKQLDELEKASGQYLDATTWTPERRKEYVSGMQGLIGEQIGAEKKRAAETGAEAGKGGGAYGRSVEAARRRGNEMAARLLSETYAPTNVDFNAFANKNQNAYANTLNDALGLAGNLFMLKNYNRLIGTGA